jgi:hypothetical protein
MKIGKSVSCRWLLVVAMFSFAEKVHGQSVDESRWVLDLGAGIDVSVNVNSEVRREERLFAGAMGQYRGNSRHGSRMNANPRHDDLETPGRRVSLGRYGDDSRRGAVGDLAAHVVGAVRHAILASDAAARSSRVVAGPPASRRDCGVGAVLLGAEVPAGCGVIDLFLRGHLTTLGYGDLVLPQEWRLLGPVEGLAGILMCATGSFFAVVSKFLAAKSASNKTDL